MSDDSLDDLMNARISLTKMRLELAQTLAAGPNDAAVKGLVDIQRAIEVIDVAIDELTEELEEAEAGEE